MENKLNKLKSLVNPSFLSSLKKFLFSFVFINYFCIFAANCASNQENNINLKQNYMKKTYLLMFALLLTMLGISDAMAQKIYRAERAASPLSEVNVAASYDVICVDFGVTTNLKDLVKASPSNT